MIRAISHAPLRSSRASCKMFPATGENGSSATRSRTPATSCRTIDRLNRYSLASLTGRMGMTSWRRNLVFGHRPGTGHCRRAPDRQRSIGCDRRAELPGTRQLSSRISDRLLQAIRPEKTPGPNDGVREQWRSAIICRSMGNAADTPRSPTEHRYRCPCRSPAVLAGSP